MLVTTSPVTVLHRGPYSQPGQTDPIIWGPGQGQYAGQLIEKVMLLDPATNVVLDNFTVAPYLNGELKNGDVVVLDCECTMELVSSRTQRPTQKYKWRVVAARPAKVEPVKAA